MGQLNFNENELIKRVEDRINRKSKSNVLPSNTNEEFNSTVLMETYNILDVDFFSHRKYIGKFIVLTKRILRKLLKPILAKQTSFNRNLVDALLSLENSFKEFKNSSLKIDTTNKKEKDLFYEELQKNLDIKIQKYFDDKLASIDSCLNDMKNEMNSLLSRQTEIQNNTIKEHDMENRIISQVFSTLSEIYHEKQDYQNSYYFLLLALKYASEDKDIEERTLQTFKKLNQSRS
jgi:hypothetical protein